MDVLGWSAGKADWQELIWPTGIMILLAPATDPESSTVTSACPVQ
jgi:hypothetical protein